jgi:Zn-dependent peptidase ImmA (M78 family)/transcriptional regulator with XRE-family HTH domain
MTTAVESLPARIREARTAVKMTAADLAAQLGVHRNTVLNYENGSTEPPTSQLLRIGQLLGCGLLDLLGLGAPQPAPRFAFRANKPAQRRPEVLATARRLLRTYQEIEELLEAPLQDRLPRRQLDMPSSRQVEVIAEEVRELCGLAEVGPASIVQALESIGVRGRLYRFDEPGLDGLSVQQGGMSLILLNQAQPRVERVLFSAAHELGHLVLHQQLFADADSDGEDEQVEKEADQFAAALLVPESKLLDHWQADRLARAPLVHALIALKEVFPVSVWCLVRRVQELGLVGEVDYARLTADIKHLLGIPRAQRTRKQDLEPAPLPPAELQVPTRFSRLVRLAYVGDVIGVAKVAELLEVPVDEAKEVVARWVRPY